ncbi:MAG: hypothetical protein JWP25_4662 [Bradyrhizobium sp.]|nr:hypothetical protein [Bradyrhizobium sp.]
MRDQIIDILKRFSRTDLSQGGAADAILALAEGERPVRSFMDGIDWQHHLGADASGTELFPNEESLREKKTCLTGGCGVVEVETRLIRWVEPQNLKYEDAPIPNTES